MPSPRPEVAIALIESYLNMRVKSWGVTDEEFALLPEKDSTKDSTPGLKTKVCQDILIILKHAQTTKDWAEAVYFLAQKEEKENDNASRSYFSRFLNYFYDSSKLLRETIHTIISYINSQLKDDLEFKRIKNDLASREKELLDYIKDAKTRKTDSTVIAVKEEELKTIQQNILALNVTKDNLETHFAQELLKNDPYATILGETSFAKYVQNAKNDKRPNKYSDMLLAPKPVPVVKPNVEPAAAEGALNMVASKNEIKGEPLPAIPHSPSDNIGIDKMPNPRRSARRVGLERNNVFARCQTGEMSSYAEVTKGPYRKR